MHAKWKRGHIPNCEDLDLSQYLHDALNSLKIVPAAEESLKTGLTLEL
jgi:hypothetical protein